MYRAVRLSLVATLVLGLFTGCDFGAAEDAVDDFEVIVGLPSLATVVNVQALDASDDNPIESEDVQVTFEGADADAVVDIYSDPLSSLIVQGGFANFAVDSTRSPSQDNPVRLTLRANAPGYNSTSVSVQVTQEGSVSRVIRLTPEDPEQSSAGTSGDRQRVSADQSGTTQEAVMNQTGTTSEGPEAAQGSASIPSGTTLQTASGESLQGQVTTDLSVFDNSAEAQELMPVEAKTTENRRRQIQGAVRFQVQDGSGRTASQFDTEGEDASTVAADLPALSSNAGTSTVTFVNPETGESRTVELSSSSSSGATHTRKQAQDETTFRFVGSEVIVNSPSGTGQIDLSTFEGTFFAAVGVEPAQRCTPQGTLDISPNGHQGTLSVRVSGDGFSVDTDVGISDPQSSFTLSVASLFEGDIPDLGSSSIILRTPDEQEVTTSLDLCTGSGAVTLPAPSGERIDASVRVLADCPAGERLPVSPPFDGYSLSYRPVGSTGAYRTVPKENITINTTDDDLETVVSAVVSVSSVLPDTRYNFVGTFGDQSSSQEVTMPSQDGGEVTLTDQELREECR